MCVCVKHQTFTEGFSPQTFSRLFKVHVRSQRGILQSLVEGGVDFMYRVQRQITTAVLHLDNVADLGPIHMNKQHICMVMDIPFALDGAADKLYRMLWDETLSASDLPVLPAVLTMT